MKFYLLSHADSDYGRYIYSSLKEAKADAIAAQTNKYGEHEPKGITIYRMDVPVTWDTVARLLTDKGGYAKESVEVFEIGFDEAMEQARQRLEESN